MLNADTHVLLYAVTDQLKPREIARTTTQLDVRGDPADELIAATSVVHNVPILTRDRALLKSKVVPLAR